MSKPKPFVHRAATLQDAMSAIARLPSVITQAIQQWGEVEIVVRKREKNRSLDQNRLAFLWCKEAAEQGDMTTEEYRAHCKLHFGMLILCRDSEDYRAACRDVLGNLRYEQKLALMSHPFDYPVTRGMSKSQLSEYLDKCWEFFTGQGFGLTDPAVQGMEKYREAS